ncbi:hypothetical protein HJC99_04935 [Candidatus Saccharibacteria bacterium]|nr:hypothetical protein [Candidatus Saccharibacteria bacterium]
MFNPVSRRSSRKPTQLPQRRGRKLHRPTGTPSHLAPRPVAEQAAWTTRPRK